MADWSEWQAFPDPRAGGYLDAPFGPGVYELRNKATDELVLFGKSIHVAKRMTSLLPPPFGSGTRNNTAKRDYILYNLPDIEYRTKPCASDDEAKAEERLLKKNKHLYRFNT